MFTDTIDDYVEGVAAKYLSAVDALPNRSNGHEIGGLVRIGFKRYLGEPARGDKTNFRARLVYISDEDEIPETCEDTLSWYGATRRDVNRSLEYRLYYGSNPVTALFNEGDFFLIAKLTDGSILLVICPPGTTVEAQLRSVFDIGRVEGQFHLGSVSHNRLLLPIRLLLEELGLATGEPVADGANWLERLVQRFGGTEFPVTAMFSDYARESLSPHCDPVADPDAALLAWMDHEEYLFRVYERHLVQHRLRDGFGSGGDDVDEFISYSLSVQNRRKSRVGHAFEGHLEMVFKCNDLRYERARGKGKVTENNSKPDFIFPSFSCYQDRMFPSDKLIILGAKTTCKDRWRQVLAEANRVKRKHLVTMEPAISCAQTDEMASVNLQLVVPLQIHQTYTNSQQSWLQDIAGFIAEVKDKA